MEKMGIIMGVIGLVPGYTVLDSVSINCCR